MKALTYISAGVSLLMLCLTVAIFASAETALREQSATTAALAKAVGQAFLLVDQRIVKLEPKEKKK